jgi:hypothetical protein
VVALLFGLVFALLAGGLLAACGTSAGVPSARRVIDDDHRFNDGLSAGGAFIAISEHMLRAAQSCAHEASDRDPRCAAQFGAAAQARAESVAILSCGDPGRVDARQRWRGYLGALGQFARRPTGNGPQPPPLPTLSSCE